MLATAALLTVLDSLAKAAQIFAGAVGTDGSVANTVAKGAASNVETLLANIDSDVAAIVPEFARRAELVVAGALYRSLHGERIQAALDAHYGGTGGLNRYLATADQRVHPDLRLLGIQIDAPNAFPPSVVTMGAFTVTGNGAGTFVEGDRVDLTRYGKANCVVRTTAVIGAAPIVATLTMMKVDGTTDDQQVTVPAGTGSGAEIDIGVHGTDMFVGVSAIGITGGTAGDAFQVRSEVERTVVL